MRSLGVQLDPARDDAFSAFEGSGTDDPVSGWTEGWFLLPLELVSNGAGACGYRYMPALVTFDGTRDARGAGSSSMYNSEAYRRICVDKRAQPQRTRHGRQRTTAARG